MPSLKAFARSLGCLHEESLDMNDLVKLRKEELEVIEDVEAVEVPSGTETVLVKGTKLSLLQELGGDFTTRNIIGIMYRLSGLDAPKIGKEVPKEAFPPDLENQEMTEEVIWEQLSKCYDPEIPVNIVELGLIYEVSLKMTEQEATVDIMMSLTAPGCGMGQVLMDDVKRKVELLGGISRANVGLTFDPPWTPERMSEEARLTTGLL